MTQPDAFRRTLILLFIIQFLSWAGMFCLWIYAVPVIADGVFAAGNSPAAYGTVLAIIGSCYALYAILGTSLSFALPTLAARWGVSRIYALGLLVGGCGIAALGDLHHSIWLIPAFIAIGVGWSVISNLPYGILSAVLPEGRGAHMLRIFGFSTVIPQVVMTMGLALIGPHLAPAQLHCVMYTGGALLICAALTAFVFGRRFTLAAEDW